MVDVRGKRCLHESCMRRPSYNYEGSKPPVYCQQHAEDSMMAVNSKLCLFASCRKGPSFSFGGIEPAVYCKRHAEDGMVGILTKRAFNDSCAVVGATRRVPTDDVPTVCVQLKEALDCPVTGLSVEALCESAVSLNRSGRTLGGKQHTRCLDHAPFEDSVVVHTAAVERARTRERYRSSLGTRLNDNGGGDGTAAKRSRHTLYRRALPP